MDEGGMSVREIIGGAIAVTAVVGVVVVDVVEVLTRQPFTIPPTLGAIAAAATGAYLMQSGQTAIVAKVTNGILSAIPTRAIRATDTRPPDAPDGSGGAVPGGRRAYDLPPAPQPPQEDPGGQSAQS